MLKSGDKLIRYLHMTRLIMAARQRNFHAHVLEKRLRQAKYMMKEGL